MGDNILARHVDYIIKLEKNPRKLITKDKKVDFKIDDSGLIFHI